MLDMPGWQTLVAVFGLGFFGCFVAAAITLPSSWRYRDMRYWVRETSVIFYMAGIAAVCVYVRSLFA